jgi:hypothetical protein
MFRPRVGTGGGTRQGECRHGNHVPPTDAELDVLIRARLQLIGIDLGQLPLSDPSAPADQTRVMSSLRNFVPPIRTPCLWPAPPGLGSPRRR